MFNVRGVKVKIMGFPAFLYQIPYDELILTLSAMPPVINTGIENILHEIK